MTQKEEVLLWISEWLSKEEDPSNGCAVSRYGDDYHLYCMGDYVAHLHPNSRLGAWVMAHRTLKLDSK